LNKLNYKKMKGLNIQSESDQIIITISKNKFDENYLLKMIERMNIEYLAKKADFDERVLDIAEEINENWWKENGSNFLKNVKI